MHADDRDRVGAERGGAARRRHLLLFLVAAVLVVGVFGFSLRALLPSTQHTQSVTLQTSAPDPATLTKAATSASPQATSDAATAEDELPAEEAELPLPELEHSDPEVRATLSDILPAAAQQSLQPNNLLQRAASLVDNFSRGKLLRDKLPLPAVGGKLLVERRVDRIFLASANFSRYDTLVDALAELDAEALGRWFNRYEPLMQQAYDELGGGGTGVRTQLLSGIDLMLAAPEVPGDIELLQPAVFYKFADPALEALPDGAKLLLRVGPRNRALLIDRISRLRQALAAQ